MAKTLRILTIKKKKDFETLRIVSDEVKKEEFGDQSFNKFLDDLLETAIGSKIPACGISSPQVGVNKRVFYINNYDTKEWELFINPIVEPINFTKIESDEREASILIRSFSAPLYLSIASTDSLAEKIGRAHV